MTWPEREVLVLYALVGAGAAIGGLARALVSLAAVNLLGAGFPYSTLSVNLLGSLAIGFYATLSGPDGRLFAGARQRQFVMTGICGGFTTFSVFSLESLTLAQDGQAALAAFYIGISLVAWLAAVWVGAQLAARLNRLKG